MLEELDVVAIRKKTIDEFVEKLHEAAGNFTCLADGVNTEAVEMWIVEKIAEEFKKGE